MIFVCFFQAEDGIRDLYVTGVQTCALPISGRGGHEPPDGLASGTVQQAVQVGLRGPALVCATESSEYVTAEILEILHLRTHYQIRDVSHVVPPPPIIQFCAPS